jgi:hypothetical protein
MIYYSKPSRVEAVQWTGENLAEVQAMLLPESPYLARISETVSTLGIPVINSDKYIPRTMKWANIGDYIIKRADGACEVYSKGLFEEWFKRGQVTEAVPAEV